MDLEIARDGDAFYRRAAQWILDVTAEAVRERGRATWALSGGNTPKGLFSLLAEDYYRERLPWRNIHVFWVDERCVPPDHPDSNFGMTRSALLSKVPLPEKNIERMPGERQPVREAARDYEHKLRLFFRNDGAWPRFDAVLLGVGDDGHTASLFPNSIALKESEKWVVGQPIPRLGVERLTLTFPVLNRARHVLFLVGGAGKAPIVREFFRDDAPADRYPAQRVRPTEGQTVWLLDKAAAARLPDAVRFSAAHI